MMQGVNLIPAPRRIAKRRRAHVRWCVAGCVAYTVLALSTAATCRVIWGSEDPSLDKEIAKAGAVVEHANDDLRQLGKELVENRSNEAANRQILAQPDWSLLMAVIGHEAGADIVLRSCTLRPASDSKGKQTSGLVVSVSAYGRSNMAVSEFVLRMEKTKLFSQVVLIESTREALPNGEAFAFKLDCPLENKHGS